MGGAPYRLTRSRVSILKFSPIHEIFSKRIPLASPVLSGFRPLPVEPNPERIKIIQPSVAGSSRTGENGYAGFAFPNLINSERVES
jgi:hypothetical protein